ncbi:hypothetical protein Q5P01_000008 [Channa striata]|uniref:DNA polymerase n=1 Tax=Channa striata TaxID=64152 RepID=A0AA88IGU5_CHASR|nr:hypothetical protein Q5P01_000008 [Channa striata]
MDDPMPFVNLFPDIYPKRRAVPYVEEGSIGVLIKSVMFHRNEEALLCRGLVLHARHGDRIYDTVCFKVVDITPVVGYDLDLARDQGDVEESWSQVSQVWSRHFVQEPVDIGVLHDDIKRKVNARVFPIRSIALARRYMENVKGALTFGDFCADTGYYVARDGNTPALCCDVMFGRMYFVPEEKANGTLSPCELVYDHERSEAEARLFDTTHAPHFYRAACLDIETVVDESFRDPSLRCDYFAHRFPYCTERAVAEMSAYRGRLMKILSEGQKDLCKQSGRVSIPALAGDMPGQEHEITCVSLVIVNSHLPKPGPGRHRKKLIVVYNKRKVNDELHPEVDHELATGSGVESASRIAFYPCSGELALLEKTVALLHRHGVELLYVYNAEFDVRVMEQRVHFYAESNYAKGADPPLETVLCAPGCLARALCDQEPLGRPAAFLPVRVRALSGDVQGHAHVRGFGPEPRQAHRVEAQTSGVARGKVQQREGQARSLQDDRLRMTVADLYRMAGTRWIKFACTSMKLNDVAPFVIAKDRELRGKPPKDPRKLRKLADVAYSKMDEMIHRGGKSLFAVLLYNLVDSQLCARLTKALRPVSALFHRCRITLNIDVVVHGRGDTFGGFVQSIHSVQMPQLKYVLDKLRAKAGPAGKDLGSRARWDPKLGLDKESDEKWKGGSVCDPLTGLHYSGPGMGLELAFDFASMYPSIMCALNISPETTVPWPRAAGHLTGWVCYSWEAEGFEYASLILRYDRDRREFTRAPAVFSSSVEHYLNKRAGFKAKLKDPALSDAERVYYKMQEGECKVMANSFYGTAPLPCGPLISGHGRRQISVVNECVSSFYRHSCPVLYGDTDSVMVSVGYGPEDPPERGLRCAERVRGGRDLPSAEDSEKELLEDFPPPPERPDPEGGFTEEGYPVYVVRTPGSETLSDVTRPFVKDRRVKLEYENSSSAYCHVAKKSYVSLTHGLDDKGDLSSLSVKIRGLSAVKSMRSPCDSAVTETFISCVMRGDCVKLEPRAVSCFSTCPWHRLAAGDVILYPERELTVDVRGRWLQLDQAASILAPHRVQRVVELQLDKGFSAVSVTLARPCGREASETEGSRPEDLTVVRSLYKDRVYCLNHMLSSEQAVLRDLLACRASELIASKMGAGFFPWSSLIKSAKNKHFDQQTLERLKVSKASVKTTYVEIVRTWLQKITGLSTKPVECHEFYKCNPCEAAFYRYPLNLQATAGCTTAMFGGSLACEPKRVRAAERGAEGGPRAQEGVESLETTRDSAELIPHPYQPFSKCFSNSRVLLAHRADRELINRSGKLVAHCIVDYCLPRHMYGSPVGSAESLAECKRHLLVAFASIRGRLKRATAAFNSIMNNCPEHMIPPAAERRRA